MQTDQVSGIVQAYLRAAVSAIDRELGEGVARKHPELVGRYLQACSLIHSRRTPGGTDFDERRAPLE